MKAWLVFLVFLAWVPAAAAPFVTYEVKNHSDAVERNVPVTFGAIFADGDVPAGSSVAVSANSQIIPAQIDIKAKHKDGSLRHAIVTVVLPRLAEGRSTKIAMEQGPARPAGPSVPLPSNLDAVVDLTLGGNHLTASLHEAIRHARPDVWLSGPLMGEWWFSTPFRDALGKPDPHLSARFGVRAYASGGPTRIDVVVENTWTWVPDPRTLAYDATIRVNGREVFTKDHLIQQAHTRWRLVFWTGAAPDLAVKFDLAYLKKARVIPNFADSARVPDINGLYKTFRSKNRGPMGPGIIYPAMPVTGGRPDIGPLPDWTVAWLLTMDPRAEEMTLNAGDLSGSFPSHYRSEKADRPATSEQFPKISTHYNYVGRGNGNLALPDTAGLWQGFTPEPSHEPSLAFIPYLVTGERYYLEELQFWSQWNAWGTAPEYHGFGKGLIGWDQIRGQGWSLRTLAQAAYITPDADPMKATLLREMKANAEWFDATYTNNSHANIFHTALRASDDAVAVAPWMDDYLTWATQYAVQLGFDEFKPFARWKAAFPVQRMINPDYCAVMAAKYYMRVMDQQHHFLDSWAKAYVENLPQEYRDPGKRPQCGSDEMAAAFKLKRAGEMMGDSHSPGGYPAQMQPALAAAVDAGVPGAMQAWQKFKSRPVQPPGGVEAKWDIIPWTEGR